MTPAKAKERTLEVVLGELFEEIGKLQELLPAYLEERRTNEGKS
jgi:hypothetical protein